MMKIKSSLPNCNTLYYINMDMSSLWGTPPSFLGRTGRWNPAPLFNITCFVAAAILMQLMESLRTVFILPSQLTGRMKVAEEKKEVGA